MNGNDLLAALSGTQYKAAESPWGIAATTLSGMAPNLVNPYGSTGANIGISAGTSLLTALLAGIAQNEATSENARMAPILSDFMNGDNAKRQQLVNQETRLGPLYTALMANELDNSLAIKRDVSKAQAMIPVKVQEANEMLDPEIRKMMATNVGDLYKDLGMVPNPQGGEPIQVYDPITQEAEKKKATLLAEAEANKQINDSFGGGARLAPKDLANLEVDYTTKLTTGAKAQETLEVESRAKQVLQAIETRDPLAAATAIYGMAKLLDPQGVVRKEDGTIVANPGGPAGQLESIHNELIQKGQLTDQSVASMKRIVPQLLAIQYQSYARQRDAMIDAAVKQGARKDNIGFIKEYQIPADTKQGQPDPGALAELKRRGLIK